MCDDIRKRFSSTPMADSTNTGKLSHAAKFDNMSPLLARDNLRNGPSINKNLHNKFDLPVKNHRNILDSVRDKNLKTNLENIHKSPLLCKLPMSSAVSAFPAPAVVSASKQLDFDFEDVEGMNFSMRPEPFVDILHMCKNFNSAEDDILIQKRFGVRSPEKSPIKTKPIATNLEKSPPIPIISPPKRLNNVLKMTADSVSSSKSIKPQEKPSSPIKKTNKKVQEAFEKVNNVLISQKPQIKSIKETVTEKKSAPLSASQFKENREEQPQTTASENSVKPASSISDFFKRPGIVIEEQPKPNKILIMSTNVATKRKKPEDSSIIINPKFLATEEAKQSSSIDYSSILSMSKSANETGTTGASSNSSIKMPLILPHIKIHKIANRVDKLELFLKNAPN